MDLFVASLNLHGGADLRGAPFDVPAAIRALDAAVICLQEVWLPAAHAPGDAAVPALWRDADPVAVAAAALGLSVYRAQMCPRDANPLLRRGAASGPGSIGICVLTALPAAGHQVFQLGCGPGDDVPRVAQVLTLTLPGGGALRLVNTHLTCSAASPLQLWRLWSRLRADPVPTVIAGDLNQPGLVARRFPGLTDLIAGRSFPADGPLLQLDHILASRGVSGEQGVVLPPCGSDHLPVRARVRLAGPDQPGRRAAMAAGLPRARAAQTTRSAYWRRSASCAVSSSGTR